MAKVVTVAFEESAEAKALRASWGPGPWQSEPDRAEWTTEAGLPGLIVRNHMGALCGYVAVPPGHPLHGRDFGDLDLSCHGGLTYGAACRGDVCHKPAPGEPDNVWWFGFDCAHSRDLVPSFQVHFPMPVPVTYRDMAYVKGEVEELAVQLAALK
jgi:hypothetical protein